MQRLDGRLVLSPTDVSKHLACPHLTRLDREVADARRRAPVKEDASFDVLTRRGTEHERRYLDALAAMGRTVATIDAPTGRGTAGLQEAEQQTFEAMRAGVDVVYQATFFDGRWLGFADFLRRVEQPSSLGDYRYEVETPSWPARSSPPPSCSSAPTRSRSSGSRAPHPRASMSCSGISRGVRSG